MTSLVIALPVGGGRPRKLNGLPLVAPRWRRGSGGCATFHRWRLGFKQSSLRHVERASQSSTVCVFGCSPLFAHAVVPSGFRLQVSRWPRNFPPGSSCLQQGFSTASRGARLSPHTALPGLALLPRDYSGGRLPLRLSPSPRTSSGASVARPKATSVPGMSSPCRPSPCIRLSRYRTTTAAPPLPRFHRRVIASVAGQLLTFMTEDSTRLDRWRVFRGDPSRSLRNPERRQGKQVACRNLGRCKQLQPTSVTRTRTLYVPCSLAVPHGA